MNENKDIGFILIPDVGNFVDLVLDVVFKTLF